MKITNIALTLIALLFAYFQLNDPDPWLWVGIYLYLALVCGLAIFEKWMKWLIGLGFVGCLVGLGILLPDFIDWWSAGAESITQSMKAEKPHIELTREFLGLVLCFGIFAFQWRQGQKQRKTLS